jgi:hypothetical protein
MLLNMDGFDDNTTPIFYSANPWGTAFTDTDPAGAFSPTANDSAAVNPTRSDLHSTDQTSSTSDPGRRSLMSVRSQEDTPWQMYLSSSLSDSIHSPDLDIHPFYPQHELANEHFSELEPPMSSDYQGTINDVQPMFCTTPPLVAPQPRNIQPTLLSLMSTQDSENSLLLAQGRHDSTTADEYTVYTASMLDLSAPTFDTFLAQSAPSSPPLLSPSRDRSPTITKLVDYPSTRSGRGLTGWNEFLAPSAPSSPILSSSLTTRPSTRPSRGLSGWRGTNRLEPPAVPSSMRLHRQKLPSESTCKSSISGLTVPDSLSPPLSSSTGGSSRNSERLLKRLRQSDETPPIIKRASKARRLMVADIDSDDDGANNGDHDDSDSDDYIPSRSPSLNPSRPISRSSLLEIKSECSTSVGKKTRKGKGKAKGSAALALAVVSAGRHDTDFILTRCAAGGGFTRRKNHPIPLPIPVPNLHKKSRGRKVPRVVNGTVTNKKSSAKMVIKKQEDVEDDDDESEGEERSTSSTRSRRKSSTTTATTTTEMSKTRSLSGEKRTFVCDISSCGKCFVRSEHLKRHIRSIHTHEKRKSIYISSPQTCWFENPRHNNLSPFFFFFFFSISPSLSL